jgi:hypothetical protein
MLLYYVAIRRVPDGKFPSLIPDLDDKISDFEDKDSDEGDYVSEEFSVLPSCMSPSICALVSLTLMTLILLFVIGFNVATAAGAKV